MSLSCFLLFPQMLKKKKKEWIIKKKKKKHSSWKAGVIWRLMGELPGTFTFHRVNICSFSIYNPITLSRWAGAFKGRPFVSPDECVNAAVCHSKLNLLSQPSHAGEIGSQKFMIKSQLFIILNQANLCSSLLCKQWASLGENLIPNPLICKTPLEIMTLFSTTLIQLHAVLFQKDRWERETVTSSYVSLSIHWIHRRASTWEMGFTSFTSLPHPP